MAKLRSISTETWSDPFIEDLSPSHKLLFIYLLTNEKTNMLGIYEASVKKISFETGIQKTDVNKGLELFENIGKVKCVGNFIIITNYLKHQKFNTNMKKSAIEVYKNLPKELKISDVDIESNNTDLSFQRLSNHYGMVSKYEVEVETEVKYELEDEIELKKINHSIQDFVFKLKNVSKISNQLTFEECERLEIDYDTQVIEDTLESLENYKDCHKKYTSVNLTIRKWIKNNLKKEKNYGQKETFSEKVMGKEKHDLIMEQIKQNEINNEAKRLN